jgi:hypothetical protein
MRSSVRISMLCLSLSASNSRENPCGGQSTANSQLRHRRDEECVRIANYKQSDLRAPIRLLAARSSSMNSRIEPFAAEDSLVMEVFARLTGLARSNLLQDPLVESEPQEARSLACSEISVTYRTRGNLTTTELS